MRGIWSSIRSAITWSRRLALAALLGATHDPPEGLAASWREDHRRSSSPPVTRELAGLLVDTGHMLAVFQRELPLLAKQEVRVIRCSAKRSNWRNSSVQGRCNVVYEVGIEVNGEPEREIVILGLAPATPELRASMEARCARMRGHPWTAPFREPVLHVESLGLMLLLFPLDPLMLGLEDITGEDAARVLADVLPEGCGEAGIERIDCELIHYKPSKRAVLRIRETFRDPSVPGRTLYTKFSAEDESESFRAYAALWSATRHATYLHLPEPLAYDPGRHMLVMSEVPGERFLNDWVRSIERRKPLVSGVDPGRMEAGVRVAALALGELQRSGVRPESRRSLLDDLERLKRDRDLARSLWPDLAACADGLVERMRALVPAKERLVPAHGAYRHKQMIGDEHHMTVIDWDGLALANHALDAATFLGRLRRETILHPGSIHELERMATVFQDTFLEQEPEAARELDLYESLLLTYDMLRVLRSPGDSAETALKVQRLSEATVRSLERVEA